MPKERTACPKKFIGKKSLNLIWRGVFTSESISFQAKAIHRSKRKRGFWFLLDSTWGLWFHTWPQVESNRCNPQKKDFKKGPRSLYLNKNQHDKITSFERIWARLDSLRFLVIKCRISTLKWRIFEKEEVRPNFGNKKSSRSTATWFESENQPFIKFNLSRQNFSQIFMTELQSKEGPLLYRTKSDCWEPVKLSLEHGILTILQGEYDIILTIPLAEGS